MNGLRYIFIAVFVSEISGKEVVSCNMNQAETCAIEFQKQYDDVLMEYDSQVNHITTPKISNFCRTLLMGDSITQCYEDNIKLCNEEASKYIKVQWRKTDEDATEFCNNTVCSNFKELSVCASNIYEDGITDGQVKRFCRTFNESISCALPFLEKSCLFDKKFYYSLVARTTLGYYARACFTGCITLDETIAAINACWSITREKSLKACQKHIKFRKCLHGKGNICPEVSQLVPKFLRYDHYEVYCTTTTSTTTTTTTTTPLTTTVQTTTEIPTTESTTDLPMITTETTIDSSVTTNVATTDYRMTTEVTTDLPRTSTVSNIPETTKMEVNEITTTKQIIITPTKVTDKEIIKDPPFKDNSGQLNMNKVATENNLRSLIENCFSTFNVDNSTFHKLDFSKCTLLISTVNCLYMGLNSTQGSFLLYKLIPPYGKNITDSGLFRQCRDIIFHHSKDISRVEASCGRPKVRNPACTGHGNGLIGCNNESGAPSHRGFDVVCTVLLMTFSVLIS